jgi:hypothetical protein
VTLSASNLPPGATFDGGVGVGAIAGQFSWASATPAGVYTSTFYVTAYDGQDSETITITVASWVPTPNTLAYYNFDAVSGSFTAGPYFVAAGLSASALSVGNGTLLEDIGNPNFAARGAGWTSTTNYMEVSLAVGTGFAAVLNGASFDDRTISGGPPTWRIRSGMDGFSSNLASGGTHAFFGTNEAAISMPILSGTNVFRIYGVNAVSGFWKIDNLLFSGAVLPEGQDADDDGMADIWEIAYFGDDETSDETTDTDEDGLKDWQEYRAGTNPNDETSLLRVLDGTRSPGEGLILRWSSESNRAYIIGRGETISGSFAPIVTSPATPPMNTYTAGPSTNAVQFFRIELP